MLRKLMFRLLPIQVLLAAVGAVNGLVSSYFASNFVGVEAMSAVGLYSPINMLMAANIVQNLFPRDKKEHSVEVRVVHKKDDIILRIKDDCVPFDPAEQLKIVGDSDIDENLGIRMVFKIAKEVQYQNVLGLNVLTLHIPTERQ